MKGIIKIRLLIWSLVSLTINCYSQNIASTTKDLWLGIYIGPAIRSIPNVYEQISYNLTNFPDYNLMGGGTLKGKTKDYSFAFGLAGNYIFKKNTYLTFETGINKVDVKVPSYLTSDSLNSYSYEATKNRNDFDFLIGIGRRFQFERLSLSIITRMPLSLYGEEEIKEHNEVIDLSSGGIIVNVDRETKGKNGFSIGLGNAIGASYSFGSFSVGSEAGIAMLYCRYGGPASSVASSQNGPTVVTEYNSTFSGLELSKIRFNFSLIYHLTKSGK